ncbi:MAG: TIGR02206 family membrane protein [Anaerolineales bacterium]|jgi:hypothetical integral membrane protein (TIGR02206 family)|nr:TIGR02206 family membrane protein [Anaerolineales bacterium]
MDDFLALDYPNNPFVIFGTPHLVALAIIALVVFALVRFGGRMSDNQRKWFRFGVGTWLIINELSWHWWNWSTGQWTVQTMLPLHLCSILVFSTAVMLFTRSYFIFEFSYFLGIGAAIQAILTPDLGIYGYPHFRFFQTFISHGFIFISPFYMIFVEGYRPYWRSMTRTMVVLALYAIPVTALNLLIGSNYLFTAHKPPTASVLDMLGPWPFYLVVVVLIALVTFSLLYLPWALKDWRAGRAQRAATSS